MDTSRLGRGEMIAAGSAIVLLLVMFIFSWFSVDFGDGLGIGAVGVDTTANAWQAFGFIDIILFVTILVAVGLAVMKANSQSANLPVAGSALVAGLGILSTLCLSCSGSSARPAPATSPTASTSASAGASGYSSVCSSPRASPTAVTSRCRRKARASAIRPTACRTRAAAGTGTGTVAAPRLRLRRPGSPAARSPRSTPPPRPS